MERSILIMCDSLSVSGDGAESSDWKVGLRGYPERRMSQRRDIAMPIVMRASRAPPPHPDGLSRGRGNRVAAGAPQCHHPWIANPERPSVTAGSAPDGGR